MAQKSTTRAILQMDMQETSPNVLTRGKAVWACEARARFLFYPDRDSMTSTHVRPAHDMVDSLRMSGY